MLILVVDIGSTVYYQALCLLNEATQIKMQCTSNDKIKILRTVYGYNPGYDRLTSATLDSCAFSIKDCNFDKEFSIDNECTGRNTCLVTIRKSRVMNESSIVYQTCKDFNYRKNPLITPWGKSEIFTYAPGVLHVIYPLFSIFMPQG